MTSPGFQSRPFTSRSVTRPSMEPRKRTRWRVDGSTAFPAVTTILGNHDIWHNGRTPTQWAKAYGYRSKNFTIHLPFLRIIVVGPYRDLAKERSGKLSKATQASGARVQAPYRLGQLGQFVKQSPSGGQAGPAEGR
jgi:hypothetical protein